MRFGGRGGSQVIFDRQMLYRGLFGGFMGFGGAMSWVFSEADYHGVVYSDYDRSIITDNGARIESRFANNKSQTCLVAGCGWGFLVDELVSKGWNSCYGFDASEYAINVAAPLYIWQQSRVERLRVADALSSRDMDSLRREFGQPRTLITEDLLPCAANEAEVLTMLENLRSISHAQAEYLHFITPLMPYLTRRASDGAGVDEHGQVFQIPGMLWLSEAEWRALIGPSDRIFILGDGPTREIP